MFVGVDCLHHAPRGPLPRGDPRVGSPQAVEFSALGRRVGLATFGVRLGDMRSNELGPRLVGNVDLAERADLIGELVSQYRDHVQRLAGGEDGQSTVLAMRD